MCKKPSFDVAAARERAIQATTDRLVFNQQFPEDKKESTRSYSFGTNGKVTIAGRSVDAMNTKIEFGTASSSVFTWSTLGDEIKAQENRQEKLLGLPVIETDSIPTPNVVFGHDPISSDAIRKAFEQYSKRQKKT